MQVRKRELMNRRSALDIRKTAVEFRKSYQIREISYTELKRVFMDQGFTVIEFNPVLNAVDVSTVIHNLGLEEAVQREKGFLYTDSNYRLVFINEKLTDQEKALVLAHEEGHFYCGHTLRTPMIGQDVQDEYEANEFVHYLLEKSLTQRIKEFVFRRKKIVAACILAVVLLGGGAVAAKQYHDWKLYEGTYYVTVNGEKYHLKNCVTIQGHKTRRLTKEDVESGRYEACSVCIPDGE